MRIDPFTDIVEFEQKVYIINLRTGAIDEIDTELKTNIVKLKAKGSFSDEDSLVKGSILLNLIDKGYITSFTDKDLEISKVNTFEGYKETRKKREKIPSLVLDNNISQTFCTPLESDRNPTISMAMEKFKDIVSHLKNNDSVNEINIFKTHISNNDLSSILEILREFDLRLKSIYTSVKNASEINSLLDTISKSNIQTEVNIRDKNNPQYYSCHIFNNKQKDITGQKKLYYCDDDYFICQFLYNTYFIDNTGNINYCIKKSYTDEKIRNIFNEDQNISNWSLNMFDTLCNNEKKNCKYSLYCRKMCGFLENIRETKANDECPIPVELDKYIKEKVKTLTS
ncbi:MAG: hypothetical protein HOO91_01600 [Bacteroidales bacterium]|nr:hypothetical protein [Bacteroidales bacterium]